MDKAHRAKTGDAEIDPLDLLIPKPIGWKARLAIGSSISIAALMLGLGFGQGYLYPNPVRADFEVGEAVVVPLPAEFGDGTYTYVQLILTNTSWRDVRLKSLEVDNPDWLRIGSFGEPLDPALVAVEDGAYGLGPAEYLSMKYRGEDGWSRGEAGSRYELATSGLQELPIEIKAGESALVAFVAQAKDCKNEQNEWRDTIEAEFEFSRGSTRLPLTRTEKFAFLERPAIEIVTPVSDNNIDPNRVSQSLAVALCEAVA